MRTASPDPPRGWGGATAHPVGSQSTIAPPQPPNGQPNVCPAAANHSPASCAFNGWWPAICGTAASAAIATSASTPVTDAVQRHGHCRSQPRSTSTPPATTAASRPVAIVNTAASASPARTPGAPRPAGSRAAAAIAAADSSDIRKNWLWNPTTRFFQPNGTTAQTNSSAASAPRAARERSPSCRPA